MLLKVVDLKKSFGGIPAVAGVNCIVEQGEIIAIIGPNGAGKSTLFNVITGYVKSDEGQVLFREENITNLSPHKIAKSGISRSFQISTFFPSLTVLQNLEIGILTHNGKNLDMLRKHSALLNIQEKALSILESLSLIDKSRVSASSLSHGDKKKLDLGIALAINPLLLLLDEPTAGMSTKERMIMVELIGKLSREMKLTLVFIEHDMDVVFSIAEKIIVMHQGEFIAEGTPEEISDNNEVRAAYLGE